MESLDLKNLTKEQREDLKKQLVAEEKAAKEKEQSDRETYKNMVCESVDETFEFLQGISQQLSDVKMNVFNNFAHLLDLKKSLYGVKDGQQSHTFTSTDGLKSITLGYRVVDSYDDTVNAGIERVKTWIKNQAKDDNAANLVEIINGLLKKDAKGNLKANRVLELQNHADRIGDVELSEGVKIIREAYKPIETSYFIEVTEKDPTSGVKFSLPLSITSAPFPFGATVEKLI
jgi:hypothetical protein